MALLIIGVGSSTAIAARQEESHSRINTADLDNSPHILPAISAQPPLASPILAQSIPLPPERPAPLPEVPQDLEPLPSPDELLPSRTEPSPADLQSPPEFEEVVTVRQFNVVGSTVFEDDRLSTVLRPFLNRPIPFSELLKARDAITELYTSQGYITSGAFIPSGQVIEDGVVTIQVLEGQLAEIKVDGVQRLRTSYIRSRIELAAGQPLNINSLLSGLQLLQLNPIIKKISAELIATPNSGENDLIIRVEEQQTLSFDIRLNNHENPLLGTFQQAIDVQEANLTGNADTFNFTYQHAGSSNAIEFNYELPINSRNSTIDLGYSYADSEIIEEPLAVISPQSEAHTWRVGVQHPILETPIDRVTLGLHLEQRSSQSYIEPEGLSRIPFGFPGTGATDDGFTKLTVLQFSQEWQHQTPNQLLLLNSRLRLGSDLLGATTNFSSDEPSTEFLAWQSQALWLQRLNSDWLLLFRAAGQVADRPLAASELFGLGGAGNVRGYRKDQIVADSGLLASLELQVPILNWPEQKAVGFITPFLDYGYAWNSDDQRLDDHNLASVGAGLLFRVDERFTLRLDYALPLLNSERGNSLQESGVLLSVDFQL